MANLIELKQFIDSRGELTVADQEIPFDVKRVYYIKKAEGSARGGHRHKVSKQALICIEGSCVIYTNNGEKEELFHLNKDNKCLLLEPEDWHTMHSFSKDAILLVMASSHYDINDYIDEPY